MTSETKGIAERPTHSLGTDKKERISNTTVDSENLRLSDFSQGSRQVQTFSLVSQNLAYKSYFEPRVCQDEITPTLHKKAINWLATFCWTRNFSDEVFWYSVGYFYSYSYSRQIKKDRLTLILISAINLALKLFQPDKVMEMETMKGLLNNVWDRKEFRDVEGELLEMFEFDLYFPTVLGDILVMEHPEEQRAKILFLAQSLFMNSYEPAINDIILEDIIFVATEPEEDHQIKTQVQKLFKSPKFMDVLKQKYASKFEIDKFMEKLLKQK